MRPLFFSPVRLGWRIRVVALAAVGALLLGVAPGVSIPGFAPEPAAAAAADCDPPGDAPPGKTVFADVVALDQVYYHNRLGALNPNGMIYALRRDVVVKGDPNAGKTLTELTEEQIAAAKGNVMLREDKRARPLTLRVNVGDCLEVRLTNLLDPEGFKFEPPGLPQVDDQPRDRNVGITVQGMQLVDATKNGNWNDLDPIAAQGANVGKNGGAGNGLVAPGASITYKLYAEYENTYLMSSMGATAGAEGNGGTIAFGLFGAVNVEPFGTEWYRSQLTREEMDWAAAARTSEVQTVANDATCGTFTLTFKTGTTDPIACDADAGAVQAALWALTDIGADNVLVSGEPQSWTVEFTGGLAAADQPLLVADDTGLGGGGTTIITETVPGNEGNEFQTVANDATCGTFTLTFKTGTTDPIACDADAGAVQAALWALTDIGTGNVLVTGNPQNWTIEFTDILAGANQPPLVADDTLLGGGGKTTITETQDGGDPVTTPGPDGGQPILNYDAVYPEEAGPGKEGLPIIRILAPKAGYAGEIVHSDLNAIIAGPKEVVNPATGEVIENNYRILRQAYPESYWANQINNTVANGDEPFREFTVVFHDEVFGREAFPAWYNDPVLEHTLHGVRDGFGINYGIGGIGSEIIANRLGVGPMWNCPECKYEEFFLSAWTVGDPAMIVDVPANAGLENLGPGQTPSPADVGPKATKARYPDDPSNVHHSYLNDRVKFRNLHAGPKEHHVFHLHAHQWEFNWNTEKGSYLDSQGIGPGGGFTYEVAYGGSGNRNKTVGDAIFHCHFYPHFAQGMWELWRVHDTFERGTELGADGRPVAGARALPDPEIVAGTPIPGLVPLPGMPMAPMPDAGATVAPFDLDGEAATGVAEKFTDQNENGTWEEGEPLQDLNGNDVWDDGLDSAQVDADGNGIPDVAERWDTAPASNPGFPFFVAGVSGHRAPSPPMDLLDGHDGGLPRHVVTSGPNLAPGAVEQVQTRLDFNKVLHKAQAVELPEDGTETEKKAMAFHEQQFWGTFLPDGTPVGQPLPDGTPATDGFETNGLPRVRGAPFADPCRTDSRASPEGPKGPVSAIPVSRTYKGANIELDLKMNKVGWHFPQQRIISLWEDVGPTLGGDRAPEPLVMRVNAGDCVEYQHTNLTPSVYELDDFQVRTPTDIIGQHIHLVKFDVLSADGSANGHNYEDGTFSPDEVRERIHAFNAGGFRTPTGIRDEANNPLRPTAHPFFGATGPQEQNWLGARTTIQRWYADPLLNRAWDGGVGTVFTHDHYGPSTHQQVGLYATVLAEPKGSEWRDPETGAKFGTRDDGGPTSWRADITGPAGGPLLDNQDPPQDASHREFYFGIADFQHAYEAGGGAPGTIDNEAGAQIPSYADFKNAINPSFRQEPPQDRMADLFWFPPFCPGGVGRPCPEAISADDPGTYVVNYRNEPIGLRVFDPAADLNGNGRLDPGEGQTAGDAGDLARAFQTRTDRAIGALNTQPGFYPPLTADVKPGDPFTPLMRAYQGDKVRVRVQVGAHEEEHNFMIHGMKWLQEPLYSNSGYRNTGFAGISEYFNLETPVVLDIGPGNPASFDYLWTMGAQTEDLWNGVWGIFRSYGRSRGDLLHLPNNDFSAQGTPTITNIREFDDPNVRGRPTPRVCPTTAPERFIRVTAVRAQDVLGADGLVYNSRGTAVANPDGVGNQGAGPLIDPTALLYVQNDDLTYGADGKPNGLKPGTPVEPLILRANAGDCIEVELTNALPPVVPDKPGFSALPPIVAKDKNVVKNGNAGIVTFNANDLTPSSLVGLHPQLLEYNVRQSDGFQTGINSGDPENMQVVAPGTSRKYTWYAGDIDPVPDGPGQVRLVATPVEFGAINLMPADRIKGSNKGLVGALVIEPEGADWVTDAASRASATVTFESKDPANPDGNPVEFRFREFVTVLQDDVNLRYKGGCPGVPNAMDCAVPNIAAEGPGVPEDPQDSGQKAINYGTEPIWFRLGVAPNTPFEALRDRTDMNQVFRNDFVGGDPQTPVFVARTEAAGGPNDLRMRLLQPGGHARGHEFTVLGHPWQRAPYVNGSERISWTWHEDPTKLDGHAGGTMVGHNMVSWWIGAQDGIGPSSHFDLHMRNRFGTVGDFLFRDFGSFGSFQGLWGILRWTDVGQVNQPPQAVDDAFDAKAWTRRNPQPTNVVAPGVLANDTDPDGDPMTAELVTNASKGTVTLKGDGSFTYLPTVKCSTLPTPCIDTFTYRVTSAGAVSDVATVRLTVK